MVFLTLCQIFLKVGLFSFGGGNAMLPLIFQSVEQFGVMTAAEFSDLVAISQVTPGPVAVNAATYVGLFAGGILGAIIATICVCLPCFAIMILVIKLLDKFKDNKYVEGAFVGIRPVTIGLIAAAAIFVAQGVLIKGGIASMEMFSIDYYNFIPIGLFIVSIAMMLLTKIKPIIIMLAMGAIGAIIYGVIL